MIGDLDYGKAMAEEGLAQTRELTDEFEQLRYTGAERLAGRLSEQLLHGVETPIEYLTPMSPAAKLIRRRSAIEEYVASEAIGTGNAFWDRPVENFLKPAADMALYSIGFSGIPEQIRQRRDINEYFDMLEWTKSEMMEQRARQEGRWQDVKEQQQIQQETMFGVDVFGSPVNVMKALPRRERDFYASFVEAQTQDEREQILKLIPPNERRVYLAQWLRQEEGAARAKQEAKIAQDFDDRTLAAASIARKAEGYPISPELEEQWMEETGGKIPYDEWIRLKKAEEYFSTHSLPGAEWLAWSPSVDLDDVKLKYVEMAGCISSDSCLFNSNFDEIEASRIETGMSVMSPSNRDAAVKRIFRNPNNKPVYRLKNSGLHLGDIVITGNHIVPVVRQSGGRYAVREVSVEHIRPRDKMMYPKISFDEWIRMAGALNQIKMVCLSAILKPEPVILGIYV
jgi:hypothetical protein